MSYATARQNFKRKRSFLDLECDVGGACSVGCLKVGSRTIPVAINCCPDAIDKLSVDAQIQLCSNSSIGFNYMSQFSGCDVGAHCLGGLSLALEAKGKEIKDGVLHFRPLTSQ